jgi:hypothetical protein
MIDLSDFQNCKHIPKPFHDLFSVSNYFINFDYENIN